MVGDLGGGGAGGVESVTDAEGGDGETDVGVSDVGVRERFGADGAFFHHEFLAEVGDSATKFGELAIATANEAAKLGAAEAVAFDGVIDGTMG